MTRALRAALLALLLTGCAADSTLAQFRRTLAEHQSATVALETWCGMRGISPAPHIEALVQDDSATTPATPAIVAALALRDDETVRARHVLLVCGKTVLSDARNWYVPQRLTAAMNHTLETTSTPFGKVVAPLGLHRQPLAHAPAQCPGGAIEHTTALLRGNDSVAYSLVSECYTRANIDPPRP